MRTFVLVAILLMQTLSFKTAQKQFGRVKEAYSEKEETVKHYFTEKNISFDGFQMFIRVFKWEKELEVWVRPNGASSYKLLHTYDVCATSGALGPKRREGDLQIPEGVYHINHFNPQSNFHLSLGLNYPNASDKILSDRQHPGGSIYIHGNCVTIGCVPITDDKIKELYILAVEARTGGQSTIPVHVFPSHLSTANMRLLEQAEHKGFWQNLQLVYDDFEKTKILRPVKVNSKGLYYY